MDINNIELYSDKKFIADLVRHFQKEYPSEKIDDLEIPFDNYGDLLISDYLPETIYDKGQWIKNPKKRTTRENAVFVSAIRIDKIIQGSRQGGVLMRHYDGRLTRMSFENYADAHGKAVKGWIIGRFKHVKRWSKFGLELVEALV